MRESHGLSKLSFFLTEWIKQVFKRIDPTLKKQNCIFVLHLDMQNFWMPGEVENYC